MTVYSDLLTTAVAHYRLDETSGTLAVNTNGADGTYLNLELPRPELVTDLDWDLKINYGGSNASISGNTVSNHAQSSSGCNRRSAG